LHVADESSPELKLVERAKNAWEDSRYVGGELRKDPNLYVIGPQRASNLVYEVARQLGGAAVVAIEQHSHHFTQAGAEISIQPYMHQCIITSSLSLPIPDKATVLFVTDKMDENEMLGIIETTIQSLTIRQVHPGDDAAVSIFPCVLCLVNQNSNELIRGHTTSGWKQGKIISLHQVP
jgi:uncharacterized protein YbjQ (UPF0145 family)